MKAWLNTMKKLTITWMLKSRIDLQPKNESNFHAFRRLKRSKNGNNIAK